MLSGSAIVVVALLVGVGVGERDFTARVPVRLRATNEILRYEERPFDDVYGPPCRYPGAKFDSDKYCELDCQCEMSGEVHCNKTCPRPPGRRCLVLPPEEGECCIRYECANVPKGSVRARLPVRRRQKGRLPTDIFCDPAVGLPRQACTLMSSDDDEYDMTLRTLRTKCERGRRLACLQVYIDAFVPDDDVESHAVRMLYVESEEADALVKEESRPRVDFD